MREFIANHKDHSLPWECCAAPSAGNGALMRISAALLPFVRDGGPLYADAALNARITHNDRAAIS